MKVLKTVQPQFQPVINHTFSNYKNSAEVDIAPALGEITTVCNVSQAKTVHGACMKSMSRVKCMSKQRVMAHAPLVSEGNSLCKVSYLAIAAAVNCTLILDYVNFDKVSEREM